ncbi:MAG: hypothetical protein KKA81_16555 [Bacteroidetes bacterium]|nr:hypothetical protein [Bacteroidota bacterium]
MIMHDAIEKQLIEIRTTAGGLVAPLVRGALIIAVGFIVLQLARCDASRERDAFWRKQIKEQSRHVTDIIKEAGRTLPAADRQRLEELEKQNDEQKNELEELRRQRASSPLSDPCSRCLIPAERLRVK